MGFLYELEYRFDSDVWSKLPCEVLSIVTAGASVARIIISPAQTPPGNHCPTPLDANDETLGAQRGQTPVHGVPVHTELVGQLLLRERQLVAGV